MPTLWTTLRDPRDLWAATLLLETLAADQFDRVEELFQSVEPGTAVVPIAGVRPHCAAFYSPNYVIVACSGTENILQQLGNISAVVPSSHPPFPGLTHHIFATQASAIIAAVGPTIEPLLQTRTLVLMGHSRGGAVASLLASVWGPQAARCHCYLFGTARAGNSAFTAVASTFTINIQNQNDAITILPPHGEELPSLILRYLGVNDSVTVRYDDCQEIKTLSPDGRLTDGAQADVHFWSQVTAGAIPTHEISVYREWLTLADPIPVPAPVVTVPQNWTAAANYIPAAAQPLTISFAPTAQGFSMPSNLVAGTTFFKTVDRTFGWTETWYAAISQATMIDALRNLTAARLAFLSPGCVIYWYRASVVEIGQPRQSVLFKRSKPAKGTARPGGTVAADYPNSTMDCIVATIYSTQGSKRQEKYRGLPDAYLEDDDLSAAGEGALSIIDSYLRQVKAAGLGIRRQTMAPTDKMAITAVDVAANGNINLTVPAHGILETQPFRALIRGRDLSNPMMRGTWNLQVIDANTLQCISSTRFGKGGGAAGGNVTVAAYGADSITAPPVPPNLFDFNQVSTIKTGRPSDLHHGKRSAVVRHR